MWSCCCLGVSVLFDQEVVVLRMWSCWLKDVVLLLSRGCGLVGSGGRSLVGSGGRCLEDVVLLAQEVVV